MKKLDAGTGYVRYAIGELTVIALRDGYVDMPSSRLRQSGDRPFGSDLPKQVELVGGKLRLSVNAFLVMLIWGDTVHVPSIQFAMPELTWELDANQNQAPSSQLSLLRRAVQLNFFVADAHLNFPGVGTVSERDDAFCFTPV
jgi:hypothetical protein